MDKLAEWMGWYEDAVGEFVCDPPDAYCDEDGYAWVMADNNQLTPAGAVAVLEKFRENALLYELDSNPLGWVEWGISHKATFLPEASGQAPDFCTAVRDVALAYLESVS